MENTRLADDLVEAIKEYFINNVEYANFLLSKESRAWAFLMEAGICAE